MVYNLGVRCILIYNLSVRHGLIYKFNSRAILVHSLDLIERVSYKTSNSIKFEGAKGSTIFDMI
jgi:hypothetical protein